MSEHSFFLDLEHLWGLKIQASRHCALVTGVREVAFWGACVITHRRLSPLKTEQQAPRQGSFKKEMSKEQNAHSGSWKIHIFKLLMLFFTVIQILSKNLDKGVEHQRNQVDYLSLWLVLVFFIFYFFSLANLSTFEKVKKNSRPWLYKERKLNETLSLWQGYSKNWNRRFGCS